jgi:ribosome-binding factor A
MGQAAGGAVSTRTDRVSDLIKDEISRLLLREVRDPRIGFVTITGASVSADLKSVRVHVSVLAPPEARRESLKALNAASGFFRRSLFKNLGLRFAPAVSFHLDESLDRGDRIERVLRQIHGEERTSDGSSEEE